MSITYSCIALIFHLFLSRVSKFSLTYFFFLSVSFDLLVSDRVHPGHARKMVRSLLEEAQTLGKAPEVFYWENIEGGHGVSHIITVFFT